MGALKMVYATDLQDVKPEGRARIERFKARVEAQRVAGAMSGADPSIEGALRALLDVDRLQAALARGRRNAGAGAGRSVAGVGDLRRRREPCRRGFPDDMVEQQSPIRERRWRE